MKKILLCLPILVILLATCKNNKEEDQPCNGNGFFIPVHHTHDSALVTQNMKPSPGNNRAFYWRQSVSDVCASVAVKGEYEVLVRKDMDSAVTVRFSRTGAGPNGIRAKTSTPVKSQQIINGVEYYIYSAQFDENICENCAVQTPYNYELRTEIEISATAGDPATYIGNSIPKVILKSEYIPF